MQKEKNAEEFAARARAMQFARGALQAAAPSRRCPRRRTALLLPAAGVQSVPQKEIGANARMGWAICVKCVLGSIGISISYAAKSEKPEPCNERGKAPPNASPLFYERGDESLRHFFASHFMIT